MNTNATPWHHQHLGSLYLAALYVGSTIVMPIILSLSGQRISWRGYPVAVVLSFFPAAIVYVLETRASQGASFFVNISR